MHNNRGPERPVSEFAAEDYCFGIGPLWLRVERVHWDAPVDYSGDTWYQVDGMEVSTMGLDVRRRRVLVRAQRLTMPPAKRCS